MHGTEGAGASWSIVYKRGTTNITTVIKSTQGYEPGVLAPGASEIITIELTPNTGVGTSKSSTFKVFLGGADKVTRDAVKASTTVATSGTPAATLPESIAGS